MGEKARRRQRLRELVESREEKRRQEYRRRKATAVRRRSATATPDLLAATITNMRVSEWARYEQGNERARTAYFERAE